MTQFGGSLRFVQLPAVTQLLAELGSSGRLRVAHDGWTGELLLRDGHIVAASLGNERGRAALESIAMALSSGDFSFIDEVVSPDEPVLLKAADRAAYLDRLMAERQKVLARIPSLSVVPRLADTPAEHGVDTQITIGASALQLIPALVHGHTLEHVARERGLARTLRDLVILIDGGLVRLDPAPVPVPPPAVAKPAPVAPPPAPAPAPALAKPAPPRRPGLAATPAPGTAPAAPVPAEPDRHGPQPWRRGPWRPAPVASAEATPAPATSRASDQDARLRTMFARPSAPATLGAEPGRAPTPST